MEELTPGQLNVLSAKTATWDKYTLSTVIPDGLLTPREFFILSEIYEKGTPIAGKIAPRKPPKCESNQEESCCQAEASIYGNALILFFDRIEKIFQLLWDRNSNFCGIFDNADCFIGAVKKNSDCLQRITSL